MRIIKMRTKRIINSLLFVTASLLATSCMDGDWDSPKTQDIFGNASIDTTGTTVPFVTIADIKAKYPQYAADYTCTEIKDGGLLRCHVTGNDIEGNLYNSIAVEDENGDALIVAIGEGNLYGYLPVGQEIIIDVKGLYIGGYGQQPQLGYPYTNKNGSTYVSRMSSYMWQKHFCILDSKVDIEIPRFTPAEFRNLNMDDNCGKLMTITNVTIKGADGTLKWAEESKATNNTVSLYFAELSQSYAMVYTSAYAKFANSIVPTGKLNLTGIWKRYRNAWELVIRSADDIEVVE